MKKIIICQRLDKLGKFNELRDNLDVRLTKLLFELGYIPIQIPVNTNNIINFINEISPEGIILSGGGNPRNKDKRYLLEKKLIEISIKKKIPLLGICRGTQRINMHFGGKLMKIKDHVRKKHRLLLSNVKKKIEVMSYHELGFNCKMLGKKIRSLGTSNDQIVKYLRHSNYNIVGVMWHPERNKTIKDFDKKIIKDLFK